MSQPESWLRGPVAGVTDGLQPVAHALLFAREELERLLPELSCAQVWQRPHGAAAIGWHVRHGMGSLQRLLGYARGEGLSAEQVAMLASEQEMVPELDGRMLLDIAVMHIDAALRQLANTNEAQLGETVHVGRKRIESTVRGVLFHAAEHTARHVGQIATTVKLVR